MLLLTRPASRRIARWRPLTSMFDSADSHNTLKWCVCADAPAHTHTHTQTLTCMLTDSIGCPTLQSAFTREKTNGSAARCSTRRRISLPVTSSSGLCGADHGGEVRLMKPQLSKETLIDAFISLSQCCGVSPPSSPANALPPAVIG